MTVSTEISSNEYTGNGVTTDFDYKFRIFKANQLSVITSDADGDNVVTLRLGTDYTVTDANKSAGGKVILTRPLANGLKISITRDIPITQETSFRNQSKFFAETHENAFDYLTMLMQRLWGRLGLFLSRPSTLASWFDAKGYRIANIGKPKSDSDVVDLGTLKDEISGVNSTILKREKRLLRVDDMDIVALPKASDRAGNVLTFDKDGKPIVIAPATGSAIDVLNILASDKGLSYIGDRTGKTAQEVIDELRVKSIVRFVNPPKVNLDSSLVSVASIESSELIFGKNNTLNEYVELIVNANKTDDIDVYIHGELASQINTTQDATHIIYGMCNDLDRNGFGSTTAGITIVSQSDDKVHIRLAISSLTKDYLAFSYRNQPNSTLTQKVFKMVIKQSGAVIARTHFDFIGGSDKWAPPGVSTKNINFNNEFVQRLQIDRNVSRLKSSGILKISPDGADRYKGDTFSLKFTYNVIRPSFMNFIREVQVMAGEYKEGGISQAFFINSPTRIISIGGYADIYLGQYPSTSDWVQIQSSPRYTFSAPYDWESSPDPAIRAGTKQPYVGVEVPRWKTKSMRDYALKQVGSKALVLATDFSYWYDWENKTVYWSFGEVNDTAYIFISEADYGLNVASSVVCTMSGVRFYGSKDNPVRCYAGSYLSFNRGGGLLSLHNCEVHGSYTGNGFATSNIDSELINCKSFSVNNDGFNAHNAGIMNIVGGGAYHSGDDGASPHENCIMYMQDVDVHYSFAGNVTVAFGAAAFCYRLSSIAADNLSTKPYSGTLSVISGQGAGATAYFLDCYTDTRGIAPSEYYAQSQEAGKKATINISRRRRGNIDDEGVIGSSDTIIILS
ncbi:hypothetical protein AB7W17_03180 [Providencia rettgeri]